MNLVSAIKQELTLDYTLRPPQQVPIAPARLPAGPWNAIFDKTGSKYDLFANLSFILLWYNQFMQLQHQT